MNNNILIDLSKDKLYNKVINIINIEDIQIKPKGSYLKFGRKKACDLDMNIFISNNYVNTLKNIISNLDKNRNKFQSIHTYFTTIEDNRIINTLKSIGYLDGLFNVINYNLQIDNNLPLSIQSEINKVAKEYEINNSLLNYIKINKLLLKLLSPTWNIDELLKGEKKYNDIIFNIYNEENMVNNKMQINCIIDNFDISYTFWFGNKPKMDKNEMKIRIVSMIKNNDINYYLVLKKFQVFLKWGYYNKIFKDKYAIKNALIIYDEISKFRNNIGDINYKVCKYERYVSIYDNDKKEKAKKKVDKYFTLLNNNSKKLYLKLSENYKKYLQQYIIYH
jgi:hypothetical protein